MRLRPLAFATFLVWRLRIGASGVGACGFWRLWQLRGLVRFGYRHFSFEKENITPIFHPLVQNHYSRQEYHPTLKWDRFCNIVCALRRLDACLAWSGSVALFEWTPLLVIMPPAATGLPETCHSVRLSVRFGSTPRRAGRRLGAAWMPPCRTACTGRHRPARNQISATSHFSTFLCLFVAGGPCFVLQSRLSLRFRLKQCRLFGRALRGCNEPFHSKNE